MTVSPPPTDIDRLAEVLAGHQFVGLADDCWTKCLCGWTSEECGDDDDGSFAQHEAEVLAPVVSQIAARRAAEELEAAAAAYESDAEQPYINHLADTVYRPGDCLSSIWLRARAAALVAAAPTERTDR